MFVIAQTQGPNASHVVSGPYTAHGVQFNSARLSIDSIVATDNEFFSFAGWFKAQFTEYFGNPWVVDPQGDYLPDMESTNGRMSVLAGSCGIDIQTPGLTDNVWMHLMGAFKTNAASGSKTIVFYMNDVKMVNSGTVNYFDTASSFNFATNDKRLTVGDDTFDDFYTGVLADLSIWPGVSFLTGSDIAEATRRLFIDEDGRPVDPSVAVAALGSPAVMLTGSSIPFPLNSRGTSGPMSLETGTLTDVAGP